MKNMKKLIFLTLTYVIPNLIYAQKQPLFQSESSFIIESVAKQGKVKTIRATSFDIINLSGQITAGKISSRTTEIGLWTNYLREYNNKGLLISETNYSKENKIINIDQYTYSLIDILSERCSYTSDGILSVKEIYEYPTPQKTLSSIYNSDGDLYQLNTWDESNNTIVHTSASATFNTIYTYRAYVNDDRQITSIKRTETSLQGTPREFILYSDYKYDSYGNIIRYRREYNKYTDSYFITYQYDEHNNWVKATVSKGDGLIPIMLIKRIITLFV